MADVQQSGAGDDGQVAAARARFDSAVANAEWVLQAPPSSEPQTTAKTFNQIVGETLGELKRIQVCYELKQATDYYHDSAMVAGVMNENLYQKAKEHADKLVELLKCPPID